MEPLFAFKYCCTGSSRKYCCTADCASVICVSVGTCVLANSTWPTGPGVGCTTAWEADELALLNTEKARAKAITASTTPRISRLRLLRSSLLNMEPSSQVISGQRVVISGRRVAVRE